MSSKNCVEERDVGLLKGLQGHSSIGTDLLHSKVLVAANYISGPICHIFKKCPMHGKYPTSWKEGKIIPLPKDGRLAFTGQNCR